MSRLFGDLIQIGYVVRDLDASMMHWADILGVGPWFLLPHLAIQESFYRGKLCMADISLALAQSGPVQIELIQQHNDTPSIYWGWVTKELRGVQHHLGFGSMDFNEDVRRLGHQYGIEQSGKTGTRGGFTYLRTDTHPGTHPGTIVEIIDMAHGRAELFAGIAAAAQDWDGRDAIRTVLPI